MSDLRWNRIEVVGRLWACPMGVVVLLGSEVSVAAGPMPLNDVPAAVMAAANKIAPGVRWTDAYQEMENGQITFELEGEDAKERDVSVDVTATGKVILFENEIALSDVPAAVKAAVEGKIPKFAAIAAYVIRRGTDLGGGEAGEKSFAMDGTDDKDREVSIETSPEGKITSLDREIGMAEVPALVTSALMEKVPRFKAASAHEIHEGENLTGYIFEGTRPANAKGKGKKGPGKGNEDITVFVSADGKEVEVDAG